MHTVFLMGNLKGRGHSDELVVEGRIIY